ncbi:hypothetical protein D3C86_1314820 [compost metagenome]
MARAGRPEPVVGSRSVCGLRHRRFPFCLEQEKGAAEENRTSRLHAIANPWED